MSQSDLSSVASPAAAFELLRSVVNELTTGNRILSAAAVKSEILVREPDFSEKPLGYKQFVAFIDAAAQQGYVATLRDENGHPRVFPVGLSVEKVAASIQQPAQVAHGSRLKREVWRAFVDWEPTDYWRFWDRRISRASSAPSLPDERAPWETQPERFVAIDVVTKEHQFEWMREFAETHEPAERQSILQSLAPDAEPRSFKRTLLRLGLVDEWTRTLQAHVNRHVEMWAQSLSIGSARLFEKPTKDEEQETTHGTTETTRPAVGANASDRRRPESTELEQLRQRMHEVIDHMSQAELGSMSVPAHYLIGR